MIRRAIPKIPFPWWIGSFGQHAQMLVRRDLVCRCLDWDCCHDALMLPAGELAAARKKASEVVDAFHLEKKEQESLA